MTAQEAVKRISELLNLKFNSVKESFATTKLTDGTEVTNNLDEEFKLGQELYVVGESTLSPAPAGTHETMEGLLITVDSESIIIAMEEKTTEAPADAEGDTETEVKEESMAEIEIEVEPKEEEEETDESETGGVPDELVQAVVDALAPIVEEVKTLTEEMRKMKEKYEAEYSALKEDFTSFKRQPQRFSVTEVKKPVKDTITDYKLDVIKSFMK